MKTLDASNVDRNDLERLETTVKAMEPGSDLAFFLAALAVTVRDGKDVLAGTESDLVTSTQAARLLGVSRVHLYKLMDAGDIPVVPVGTRDRRVALSDVRSLLAERDEASKSMAERFARTDTARSAALDDIRL